MKKLNFDKIIIWGFCPLYSDTYSYIQYGYYRAFKKLGYDVYWVDNPSDIDFKNSLIFTEQTSVQSGCYINRTGYDLPIEKTSTYVVHQLGNIKGSFINNGPDRYLGKVKRLIDLRFFCDFWKDRNYNYFLDKEKFRKISDFAYHNINISHEEFYTPWATDLFPEEINLEDRFIKRKKVVNFIGTVGGGRGGIETCQPTENYIDNRIFIIPFKKACEENNIEFNTNCPWLNPLSMEDNKKIIQESFMAPDFRNKAMIDWGYIPCRIFKNISYGQLGITNSKKVQDNFGGLLVYNEDGYNLFYEALKEINNFDLIKSQMEYVRDNHTYINRANDLLEIVNE